MKIVRSAGTGGNEIRVYQEWCAGHSAPLAIEELSAINRKLSGRDTNSSFPF